MDKNPLMIALGTIKRSIEEAIITSTYTNTKGELVRSDNGVVAKNNLIRSSGVINHIHEVVKTSVRDELINSGLTNMHIHPPIGCRSPELKIPGFIKAKNQDVVFSFDQLSPGVISEGALEGEKDNVGKQVAEKSIVTGVRSQLSSVGKNYDTLMERALAEAVNLHLRLPKLTLGEVYMIPAFEYDDILASEGEVGFKDNPVKIDSFIRTFKAISNRDATLNSNHIYKYEQSALIIADFREDPPVLYDDIDIMKEEGLVRAFLETDFDLLSPLNFSTGIVKTYKERWKL